MCMGLDGMYTHPANTDSVKEDLGAPELLYISNEVYSKNEYFNSDD